MSYNDEIQSNNEDLAAILATVNELPQASTGDGEHLPLSGGGTVTGNIYTTSASGENQMGVNFNGGQLVLYGNKTNGNHGLWDSVKGTIINLNNDVPVFNGEISTMAWKKTAPSFSSGKATVNSCTGVTSSSAVLAVRTDPSAATGGNCAGIGVAGCTTSGQIILGASNTYTGTAWNVSLWWSK